MASSSSSSKKTGGTESNRSGDALEMKARKIFSNLSCLLMQVNTTPQSKDYQMLLDLLATDETEETKEILSQLSDNVLDATALKERVESSLQAELDEEKIETTSKIREVLEGCPALDEFFTRFLSNIVMRAKFDKVLQKDSLFSRFLSNPTLLLRVVLLSVAAEEKAEKVERATKQAAATNNREGDDEGDGEGDDEEDDCDEEEDEDRDPSDPMVWDLFLMMAKIYFNETKLSR